MMIGEPKKSSVRYHDITKLWKTSVGYHVARKTLENLGGISCCQDNLGKPRWGVTMSEEPRITSAKILLKTQGIHKHFKT